MTELLKKFFSLFFVLMFVFMFSIEFFNIKAFAAESIYFSLSADENIKFGKAFNIFLTFSSNADIGALRASVDYDSDFLTISSAELQDKEENDYFSYEINDDTVVFVYTNHNNSVHTKTVKLRVKQNQSANMQYIFTAGFYEAIDKELNEIKCSSVPRISVNSGQAEIISDTEKAYENSFQSKYNNQNNQNSQNNKINPSNQNNQTPNLIQNSSENSEIITAKPRANTSVEQRNQSNIPIDDNISISESESSILNEYSLSQNTNNSENEISIIFLFIGFGVLIILAMTAAFKYGERTARYKD